MRERLWEKGSFKKGQQVFKNQTACYLSCGVNGKRHKKGQQAVQDQSMTIELIRNMKSRRKLVPQVRCIIDVKIVIYKHCDTTVCDTLKL